MLVSKAASMPSPKSRPNVKRRKNGVCYSLMPPIHSMRLTKLVWPPGAQFAFNCYCHWATLTVQSERGTVTTLFSRESVTQGNPLAIVGYGIGILVPLIHHLTVEFPEVKQTWYANNAGAGGSFLNLCQFFS